MLRNPSSAFAFCWSNSSRASYSSAPVFQQIETHHTATRRLIAFVPYTLHSPVLSIQEQGSFGIALIYEVEPQQASA